MIASAKSLIQVIVLLSAILCFLDQSVNSQQFSFSQKGKKQPPAVCFATLDHFDGTTLWLKQSNPSAGSPACTVPSSSSLNSRIEIQMSIGLGAFQAGSQDSNPFHLSGPNVTNPGRIASSIAENTKDVDLQRAGVQEQQRQVAAQNGQAQSVNPPDVDLTSCKTRGTDTIQTTVNGSTLPVGGNIQDISGGWVRILRSGQTQPQKFRLMDIISITIGSC